MTWRTAGRLLATLAAVVCAVLPSLASPEAWDPRTLDRMPTIDELPAPPMTAGQVAAECRRRFDGKKYSGKIAWQPYGKPMQTPWQWLADSHAHFRTAAEMDETAKPGGPFCVVYYSYYMVGYGTDKANDIRMLFNGRVLFRTRARPVEKTGFLMTVEEDDSLRFTNYFYWGIDLDATRAPKPGAVIHKTWGSYRPD